MIPISRVLLPLLLTVSLAAAPTGAAETPLQRAITAYQSGNFQEARKAFTALYKSTPEAALWLGRTHVELGELDNAVTMLELAVKRMPASSDAFYWLGYAQGLVAIEANPIRQALLAKKVQKNFETAVRLNPSNIEARKGLVSFYLIAPGLMGGSDDKARAQALAITKLDPVEGHIALARLERKAKNWSGVEKEYAEAIRSNPKDHRGHAYLGMHLMYMEKYPKAVEELEQALKLDPGDMPAMFYLGRTTALGGIHLVRGEEVLKRYLAYKPKREEPAPVSAKFWLATVYEKTGRKDLARKTFREVQQVAPESPEVKAALKRLG